jgi:hypothetical protein
MGFRSAITKGGGFLNNVDGTQVSYEFSRRFKTEKKDGPNLYFVPVIQKDGADDTIDQHLLIGKGNRYDLSDDGQEITMSDGSPVKFPFFLPFGRFMDSLIEKGFPEDSLPDLEAGEPLELSALNGERFRYKQEVDEASNAKVGKRKVKGKDGKIKEYDRTNTVIDAVLGVAGKAAGKSAGKPAAGKATSKANDEDALNDEAMDVLRDVLDNAKTPVMRKNLSLPITKALLKNENKDAIRDIILDEDWQNAQDFIAVDKKGGVITLA